MGPHPDIWGFGWGVPGGFWTPGSPTGLLGVCRVPPPEDRFWGVAASRCGSAPAPAGTARSRRRITARGAGPRAGLRGVRVGPGGGSHICGFFLGGGYLGAWVPWGGNVLGGPQDTSVLGGSPGLLGGEGGVFLGPPRYVGAGGVSMGVPWMAEGFFGGFPGSSQTPGSLGGSLRILWVPESLGVGGGVPGGSWAHGSFWGGGGVPGSLPDA